MTRAPEEMDPFALRLRERLKFGARGGARLGLYFALLTVALGLLRLTPGSRMLDQPVTGALATISGFTVGGSVLFGLRPRVRNVGTAILLAIGCLYLAWVGVLIGLVGWERRVVAGAGVLAVISGVVFGALFWNGRKHRSA